MTAKTDRELLELAARSAGLSCMKYLGSAGLGRMIDPARPDETGTIGLAWNPLTDDGDALRLAVKARINIYNPPGRNASASVAHGEDENAVCSYLNEKSDDAAATRRAIVRAAAVMGETL